MDFERRGSSPEHTQLAELENKILDIIESILPPVERFSIITDSRLTNITVESIDSALSKLVRLGKLKQSRTGAYSLVLKQ